MRAFLIFLAAIVLAACEPKAPPVTEIAKEAEAEAVPPVVVETGPTTQEIIAESINHPDRPEADRERDAQRKPAEVMAFAGVEPGMEVLDLFTGGAWYAELLARVVGEYGRVWAHNDPQFYGRFTDKGISDRMANDRLPNLIRHDMDLDDLSFPENTFDMIWAGMIFHDVYWMADDPYPVLERLFQATKSGGHMLITDHHAEFGSGSEHIGSFTGGLHRIEEAFVVAEMERAGFELVASSDLLRVPEDDRSRAFFAMDGAWTDRFVLLFRKP